MAEADRTLEDLTPAELLVALAEDSRPKYVALQELVALGLMRMSELGELRAAGMPVYEFEGSSPYEPRAWTTARDFVRAAAIVASFPEESERGLVH